MITVASFLVSCQTDRSQRTQEALSSGQTALKAFVVSRLQPLPEHELKIRFAGEPLRFSSGSVVEIQVGSEGGHYLRTMRMQMIGSVVRLEDVIYGPGRSTYGPSWSRPTPTKVRRATVQRRQLTDVLQLIQALPTIRLQEVDTRTDEQKRGIINLDGSIRSAWKYLRGWRTVHFLVLVRVVDGKQVVLERNYAGFVGFDPLSYVPIQAVTTAAEKFFDELPDWNMLTDSQMRSSHFTEIFDRNQQLMLDLSHWWVMEYSVEALGFFGTTNALPTLRFLKATHPNLLERQVKKINSLLERPEYWLGGLPKDLLFKGQ